MRQQSREPKDIRERAVCITSSLDGFINVHETHLHYYPFSQEPTHSQTPSGSSLNKLQMGEEVRVCMYVQHLDSSCTIWVYPPYTTYIRHQRYCMSSVGLSLCSLHVDLLPKFKLSAFSFRLSSCAGLCTGFTFSSWYSLGHMSNCSMCSTQLNRQKL